MEPTLLGGHHVREEMKMMENGIVKSMQDSSLLAHASFKDGRLGPLMFWTKKTRKPVDLQVVKGTQSKFLLAS